MKWVIIRHGCWGGWAGKALIFPIAELPEMGRGRGVTLQTCKGGVLNDALMFSEAEGAFWIDSSGRRREWKDW